MQSVVVCCACFSMMLKLGSLLLLLKWQGAYNAGKTGKHGNLREFVNSGKLREFEIYSRNFCLSDATFC